MILHVTYDCEIQMGITGYFDGKCQLVSFDLIFLLDDLSKAPNEYFLSTWVDRLFPRKRGKIDFQTSDLWELAQTLMWEWGLDKITVYLRHDDRHQPVTMYSERYLREITGRLSG